MAGPSLPPGRARASAGRARADTRLSHGRVSARVARGGGSAASERTGRSAGPAAGDPVALADCFVTRCSAQRRARARCGATAEWLPGGGEARSARVVPARLTSPRRVPGRRKVKLPPAPDPARHPSPRRFCCLCSCKGPDCCSTGRDQRGR